MSEYIIIGVFTSRKKAITQQLKNIIGRMEAFGEFQSLVFTSDLMKDTPIEKWPNIDICIPFNLDSEVIFKVKKYVELKKPIVLNDLDYQEKMLSRIFVYETMRKNKIPCPEFHVFDHLKENSADFFENEDFVIIRGHKIKKPFVEKPASARRHDINIYYRKDQGGGMRKLFRKTGNCSSLYCPGEYKVRRDGTYLYERLLDIKNDLKVYAVFTGYAHGEMRKSPIIDGIVERNVEGYEIKEYCPLTYKEIQIAKKVVNAFKQNLCGFDIVRENETISYVIDVNGMNTVKYNLKYYDDMAHILRIYFLRKIKESNHLYYALRQQSQINLKRNVLVDKYKGDVLLGVVTIFRHGDRTPKQKIEIETSSPSILKFFENAEITPQQKKFKTRNEFDLICNTLKEISVEKVSENSVENHDHFSTSFDENKRLWPSFSEENLLQKLISSQNGGNCPENCVAKMFFRQSVKDKIFKIIEVLKAAKNGTKVQLKLKKDGDFFKVRIICKWGGILTEKGRDQCKRYATNFKKVYKGLESFSGFVKNSKIYASDELRVQESAKIFIGTLTGNKDNIKINSNDEIEIFLNQASNADSMRKNVKLKIDDIFNQKNSPFNIRADDIEIKPVKGTNVPWVFRSFRRLVEPTKIKEKIHNNTKKLILRLENFAKEFPNYEKNGENVYQIINRWKDVLSKFYENGLFKSSSISYIYDFLKYDLRHNFEIFKDFKKMYKIVKCSADFVVNAEFGVTNKEKKEISIAIIKNLLLKILKILGQIKNYTNEQKTFIFFASKSILLCFRNFMLQSGIASNVTVFENFDMAEFDYLSHLIIRLYEDTTKPEGDPMRMYINVMFSPGVWNDPSVRIDSKNFKKDTREILNPLLSKMSFEEFNRVIVDNLR